MRQELSRESLVIYLVCLYLLHAQSFTRFQKQLRNKKDSSCQSQKTWLITRESFIMLHIFHISLFFFHFSLHFSLSRRSKSCSFLDWSFSHLHVPSLKLAEVAFDTLCFWELYEVKISSRAFVVFPNVNVFLS